MKRDEIVKEIKQPSTGNTVGDNEVIETTSGALVTLKRNAPEIRAMTATKSPKLGEEDDIIRKITIIVMLCVAFILLCISGILLMCIQKYQTKNRHSLGVV